MHQGRQKLRLDLSYSVFGTWLYSDDTEGVTSEEECNDVGHAQIISTGGCPCKQLSFAGADPAKRASGRIPPPRWQSFIFGALSPCDFKKKKIMKKLILDVMAAAHLS